MPHRFAVVHGACLFAVTRTAFCGDFLENFNGQSCARAQGIQRDQGHAPGGVGQPWPGGPVPRTAPVNVQGLAAPAGAVSASVAFPFAGEVSVPTPGLWPSTGRFASLWR